MFWRLKNYCRSVLGVDVWTLSVQRRWVADFPKNVQEHIRRNLGRTIFYFHIAGCPRAHVRIGQGFEGSSKTTTVVDIAPLGIGIIHAILAKQKSSKGATGCQLRQSAVLEPKWVKKLVKKGGKLKRWSKRGSILFTNLLIYAILSPCRDRPASNTPMLFIMS